MGLFDGTQWERPVVCDRCGAAEAECACEPEPEVAAPEPAPASQTLTVRVEKRKRGKIVTRVAGFTASAARVKELAAALKQHCGAGGSLEAQAIEIQGDHRERVADWLRSQGFRVR